jgi:hypothetical protein
LRVAFAAASNTSTSASVGFGSTRSR